MKNHKIWNHLLPLLFAFILVAVVFFSPLGITPKYGEQQLKAFASNPGSRMNFIGNSVKTQALENKNFLPIMGSSELEKFDAYHPSSFFQKYDPKVTPYLIGQPGTQSLTQFFYLNSSGQVLKNRKIVFIISPQWFQPKGASPAELSQFISKGELYSWLKSADPKSPSTQILAQRLLSYKDPFGDPSIESAVRFLARGKTVPAFDKLQFSLGELLYKREDAIFSYFSLEHPDKTYKEVQNLSDSLPEKLNFTELDDLAYKSGEVASKNNPYQIKDSVWTNNLKKSAAKRQGQMQNISYLNSPEYTDFQQLLNQFAANHDDVQFVIQPVNGAWYSYAGLSYDKLEDFSNKITYQLQSQGFNNILDLTDKYNDKYYIGDTIHLGNRGWVALDKQIESFLKVPKSTDYQLDNQYFLSKEWAEADTSTQ